MQKLSTLIFALLLTATLSAQHEPIQPFEQELGVKVKILTLSNGKYQETFANDTLLRIGSVMYNQFTGEVVSVILNDTLYGEYNLKPEVVSRWLSPDPLAAKHPNWSPYNYTFNNPIIYVDPDGRDAILVIKPGENGANGTIIVQLTFNYSTKFTGDSKFIESAKSSFAETWGNGKIEDKGNNTFSGASFNDVDIDGQKYNVTYELAFNSVENTVNATDPGENRLFTISADNPTSSHYGDGKLDYKSSQENLSQGTTFGHELAHIMGLGHNNDWSDASGKKSISSVDVSKRDVIMKDIVETTQPAVQLAGGKGGTVILTTWRGTSNLNKVSQEDGGQKREVQYPVKGN